MRPELEDALRTTHDVAARLRERREALRRAVERGDREEVVRSARRLLGMDDEEGDRAAARVEQGAGRA